MVDSKHATALWLTIALGTLSCSEALAPARPAVESITIEPAAPSVWMDETITLHATVLDAEGKVLRDRQVFWASENGQVATVSTSGVVTGRAAGTVRIAASAEGKNAVVTATVTRKPVSSVTITPAAVRLTVGETTQLQAGIAGPRGEPLSGREVAWSSSDEGVARVNGQGLVTAIAPGTATIRATAEGQSGVSVITVVPVPVASVVLAPTTASISVGESVQFTATPRDAAGNALDRPVTWSSSNPDIVVVSSEGLAVGLKAGSATISATSEGKTASATVTVKSVAVASVTITPSTATLREGDSITLVATTRDASGAVLTGRAITWTSSRTSVATVSSEGVVRAVGVGTATITATSEGKSGTASITVVPVPVASVVVTPPSATVEEGKKIPLTATTYDDQGRVLTGRSITWSSSDTRIATVNGNGEVTGRREGTVTITATSEGKSGTATVRVKDD